MLACGQLCKIFHTADARVPTIGNTRRVDQCAQILFSKWRGELITIVQKSLFHRIFCDHDNVRTNLVVRCVRAPMMASVVAPMRPRVSQLARVHVSLSGNAVFFAVL
jgi:hypothetical protein